ncbi:hypothetical protein Tco_1306380, partial [Tanacetum coccineum]
MIAWLLCLANTTMKKAWLIRSMRHQLYVEEDTRSNSEFLVNLNDEFQDRALLANQKRFYKGSRRVGSAKKPMDKSKETCFACGKRATQQNQSFGNNQNDYKGKSKGLKAEIVVLTKKIDAMSKGKSEKGLLSHSTRMMNLYLQRMKGLPGLRNLWP